MLAVWILAASIIGTAAAMTIIRIILPHIRDRDRKTADLPDPEAAVKLRIGQIVQKLCSGRDDSSLKITDTEEGQETSWDTGDGRNRIIFNEDLFRLTVILEIREPAASISFTCNYSMPEEQIDNPYETGDAVFDTKFRIHSADRCQIFLFFGSEKRDEWLDAFEHFSYAVCNDFCLTAVLNDNSISRWLKNDACITELKALVSEDINAALIGTDPETELKNIFFNSAITGRRITALKFLAERDSIDSKIKTELENWISGSNTELMKAAVRIPGWKGMDQLIKRLKLAADLMRLDPENFWNCVNCFLELSDDPDPLYLLAGKVSVSFDSFLLEQFSTVNNGRRNDDFIEYFKNRFDQLDQKDKCNFLMIIKDVGRSIDVPFLTAIIGDKRVPDNYLPPGKAELIKTARLAVQKIQRRTPADADGWLSVRKISFEEEGSLSLEEQEEEQ